MIMYDYSKLRGRIIEIYGTLSNFGKVAHTRVSRVSELLNNKANFQQEEISRWAMLLDIRPEQIGDYFFVFTLSK